MPIKSWRNGTNWTRNLLHFLPNFNQIYWFFKVENWMKIWSKWRKAFFNPFFWWFLVPKIIKFFSTTKNIVVVVVQSNCIYLWVGSGGLENWVHLQHLQPTRWCRDQLAGGQKNVGLLLPPACLLITVPRRPYLAA